MPTYQEMPENYRQTLIKELEFQYAAPAAHKDIIIVVRNQYDHVRECLNSIQKHTTDYHLFIWDNGSDEQTNSLLRQADPDVLAVSTNNIGFIKPNNYLITLTTSPYVILLNSDVRVSPGWSEAMIGFLHNNYSCGVVGYQGGLLDDSFCGCKLGWGYDVDYVSGWCMCLHKKLYNDIGLFDINLKFAYGEDSDFCLKAKEYGNAIYALHLSYAKHEGGATIKAVKEEMDVTSTFKANHDYLRNKWSNYLKYHRILAKEGIKQQYGKT